MREKKLLRKILINWQLYLLLLPVIVYYIVFHYIPMTGIQIAFKEFSPMKGIWGSSWTGFGHFTRFFNSYYFTMLIKNTVTLSLMQLVIGFPFPILLALMLNEVTSNRFKKTMQLVTYAPHFLSVVVVIGMLSLFLHPDTGFVNRIVMYFGGPRINYMTRPEWFRWLYVFSGIWQNAGWSSIVYLAAIVSIDPTLYEAATVDGASKFQKTLYITIRGILPTVITLLILNTGHIMSVGFEKVLLMQNARNIDTANVISTYVYSSGIINAQYSFATAVGLFNSIINFVILIVVNKIAKTVSETSLF